jgi:hypothetical protein
MATSGYKDEYVTAYDTLRFNWSRSSYSIADNTSTVSWNLQLISHDTYGTINASASYAWSATVNGTSYSGSTSVAIGKNTSKILASGSTIISHNNDGTKTFAYSFSQSFTGIRFSGKTLGTVSGSGTGILDIIPRTSSVSATNGTIGNAITITINSASSSFSHVLSWGFGNLGGTITTLVSDTSYNWTLPDELYTQIPNANIGVGTIQCETFSGSTKIGTSTCLYYAYTNESVCKPTMDPTVVDQGSVSTTLTGNPDKIIKYFNTVNVAFNASAQKSATIKSMKVTCGSKSRTSNGLLEYVDSGTFIFSVTDSRGYTVSQTITKDVIDYIPLTCYLSAVPKLVDGSSASIDLTMSGNYFSGSFGAVDNTLSVQYRYKVNNENYPDEWTTVAATNSDGKYSSQLSIPDLDYTNSYTIQARASDKVNTGWIATTEQVIRIVPVFDWGKNDFNFNVPVHGKGGFTYDTPVNLYGDCNEIVTSGDYYIGNMGTNKPGSGLNGWLTVKSYGDAKYCYQRYITYTGYKYERWRNDGVWGDWINTNKKQNVLWSGALHMNGSQSITLSEAISAQKNGIQLAFSPYINNTVYTQSVFYTVPKAVLELNSWNYAGLFPLSSCTYAVAGGKELTILDNRIIGSSQNTTSGTSNGVTYNNSLWVLTYVIGF